MHRLYISRNRVLPKFYYLLFCCLLLLAASSKSSAQISIASAASAFAGNLTRGNLDTTLLKVQVTFGSACSNISATISFPEGVTYIPGSVVKTDGLGSSAITYSSGPLSKPVFTISGITIAGDITFTVKRTALCGFSGASKDTVMVTGSCGTAIDNNPNVNIYTIVAPVLSITAPADITTGVVGTPAARTIPISNGGNGSLDSFYFYAVRPAGQIIPETVTPINPITAVLSTGGTAATFYPTRSSGDTLFYAIGGVGPFGADKIFSNGEVVNIVVREVPLICGATAVTTYGAAFGRNNVYCQVVNITAKFATTSTDAKFTLVTTINPAISGPCLNTTYTVIDSIKNNNARPILYDGFAIAGTSAIGPVIDTASIMFSYSGNATPFHPTGTFTKKVTTSTAASMAGYPYTDTLLMANALSIPAGGFVTVTYNLISGYTEGCGSTFDSSVYKVIHSYRNTCTGIGAKTTSNNVTAGYSLKVNAYTLRVPAMVRNGETFLLKIPVSYSMPASPVFPYRFAKVALTLPAGLTLVSAADQQNAGLNGNAVQSGTSATYTFQANPANPRNYIYVRLRNDAACGPATIATSITAGTDSTCASGNRYAVQACNTTSSIVFRCPGSGGNGTCIGISGPKFAFGRSSYGLPDNNGDGKPDTTGSVDPAVVDSTVYMVGDTMTAISSGILTNGATVATIFSKAYAEWHFPGTNGWAPAGTATVVLKRTGVTFTCNNYAIATITALAGYSKSYRVDLTSQSCLSSIVTSTTPFLTGDSIAVIAKFRLADGLATSGTTEVNAKNSTNYDFQTENVSRVMNLLYAYSGTTAPAAGGNRAGATDPKGYTCDSVLYNAYMTGWKHVLSAGASITSLGCVSTTVGFNSQTYTDGASPLGAQKFIGEYRPVTIPDSFVVQLPPYYSYTPPATANATMDYVTKRGADVLTTFTMQPTVSGALATGIKLSYNYYSYIQNTQGFYPGTEGVIYTDSFSVKPSSCAAISQNYTVTEYGRVNPTFYTTGATQPYTRSASASLKYGTLSTIKTTNSTGDIVANTPSNSWLVKVDITSADAAYNWFGLEKGLGSVIIDSVYSSTSTTPIARLTDYTYSGGKWYKPITTGAPNAAPVGTQYYRVYFRFSNCTADSVKFISGSDCYGYPADPASEATTCATHTTATPLILRVSPRVSQIQLAVARQPGGGSDVMMCSTDSVLFVVNSALPAYVAYPSVDLIIPAGLTVTTPIAVEYPLSSGIYQSIMPTTITGGYSLDLTKHTGIGQAGIKGTFGNPAAVQRQAKIKLVYTTTCSYRSGSSIAIYGYGSSPCNSPTISNGTNVKSAALNTAGIIADGTTISMAYEVQPSTLSCGNSTTLQLLTTPLGGSTQASDTIIYTLPAGIAYSGSFQNISNCGSCTIIAAPGPTEGTTDVKIRLNNVIQNNTQIRYSFDVTGNGGGGVGEGCGDSYIAANAVRTTNTVTCNSVACGASTRVAGNSVSSVITRIKPDMALTSLSVVSGAYASNTATIFRLAYQNNGTQDAAASTYQAEIYCTGQPMPVYTLYLSRAVAIGASTADTFVINIPAACSNGGAISAKVSPVTSTGTKQCLCAERSASITAYPLPAGLISFTAAKQDAQVHTAWIVENESSVNSYEPERSTNAVTFTGFAKVTASHSAPGKAFYTADDRHASFTNTLYYRLKINYANGSIAYSSVAQITPEQDKPGIKVSPNPANDLLHIAYTSATAGKIRIKVADMTGRQLIDRVFVVAKGTNSITLGEVLDMPAGSYILQVYGEAEGRSTIRFEIAH